MGLLGLFYFVWKCIKLLAWPSFALGYPLCASIQAIETNSKYHMRKMVTYWILFSLICLFEHTFGGLVQWLPVWPNAKILVIFWLVLPRFNGASIAYDSLVCPCLSVQLLQVVLDLLNKNQYLSLEGEPFLVVAQRYVNKHGTKDLEELISIKPKIVEPVFSQDAIKAVKILNGSEAAAENKTKNIEPTFSEDDSKVVEILNESGAPAENKTTTELNAYAKVNMTLPSPLEENVQRKWTCAVCQVTTNSEATLNSHLQGRKHRTKCEELNFLSQTTTKLNAYAKVKNMTLPSPLEENVQREWTCAVCQVTTDSEATLNLHLQGRKHRTKCEELKTGKRMTEKGVTIGGSNRVRYCTICQVKTQSEATWNSHLQGQKHKSKCMELKAIVKAAKRNNFSSTATKSDQANQDPNKASPDGAPINKFSCANTDPKKTSSVGGPDNRFGCDICQVMLHSEVTLKSHLQGRKHKSKFEELKARETTEKELDESLSAITSSSAPSANNKNGGPSSSDGQNNNKLQQQAGSRLLEC